MIRVLGHENGVYILGYRVFFFTQNARLGTLVFDRARNGLRGQAALSEGVAYDDEH